MGGNNWYFYCKQKHIGFSFFILFFFPPMQNMSSLLNNFKWIIFRVSVHSTPSCNQWRNNLVNYNIVSFLAALYVHNCFVFALNAIDCLFCEVEVCSSLSFLFQSLGGEWNRISGCTTGGPFSVVGRRGRDRGRGRGCWGDDEVGVDHDVTQALSSLSPTAQTLRVKLERLEPHLSLFRLFTLKQQKLTKLK